MNVIDLQKICSDKHSNVTFIRIEPKDLSITLRDIIARIFDLSWIGKFEDEYLKRGYLAAAQPTLDSIREKLETASRDGLTGDAGETIISELASAAPGYFLRIEYLNFFRA